MNKQYNELKEKIIEAAPDIMKLKSGCKIVNDLGFEDIIGSFKGLQELETLADRKIIKIIGRPITLFDIKQCLVYYGYSIKEFIVIAELWKGKDNLDTQSDKLKDKLYDYIKNKNG